MLKKNNPKTIISMISKSVMDSEGKGKKYTGYRAEPPIHTLF